MNPSLDIAGLEEIYDRLASALDDVGEDKSELMLVKLVLLCANRIGDPRLFGQMIETAKRDL